MVLGFVAALVLWALDVPVGVAILLGVTVPWLVLAGWPILITRLRGTFWPCA
jgi:hypothetical protein